MSRSPEAQKFFDEGERLSAAGMEAFQAKDPDGSQRLAKEAYAAYRNALDLEPEDPGLLNALGVQTINLGDASGALQLFQDAVRIARARKDREALVDGLVNLAFALPGLGRREEGRKACEEALALAPDHEGAQHLMRAHTSGK